MTVITYIFSLFYSKTPGIFKSFTMNFNYKRFNKEHCFCTKELIIKQPEADSVLMTLQLLF